MREPTELEKQQDARLAEIVALARQRYLEAGGCQSLRVRSHSTNGRLVDKHFFNIVYPFAVEKL